MPITRAHQHWDWGWLTLPPRKRVTGPYLSFLPLLSAIGMQFAAFLAHGHCVLGELGVYRLGGTWERRRSLSMQLSEAIVHAGADFPVQLLLGHPHPASNFSPSLCGLALPERSLG